MPAALALWRGEPLADLSYESFAQAEIGRLSELRLVAVEERIDADLALGAHAELVAELEALIAAHPARERLRGQLMLALYRSGRQADALRIYQETRAALAADLGLDPGPCSSHVSTASSGSTAGTQRRTPHCGSRRRTSARRSISWPARSRSERSSPRS